MATDETLGIDIKGLVAPLVDLGFGLAGNAKVTVALHLTGTRTLDVTTDAMVETGAYDVEVPGFLFSQSESDTPGEDVREAMLVLNADDLITKGVPENVKPKQNDKAVINGVTWVVFAAMPIPTGTVHQLRVRR